jgi:hypothetical protein
VGSKFLLDDCSATSVDVEEHLYRLATSMGITVITSSQVSIWTVPAIQFLMAVNSHEKKDDGVAINLLTSCFMK